MTRKEKKAYIEEMENLEKRLNLGGYLTEIDQARLDFYKRQRAENLQEDKKRTDSCWIISLIITAISFMLLGVSLGMKIAMMLIEIGK